MKIYSNNKYTQAVENFLNDNWEYNGKRFNNLDEFHRYEIINSFASEAISDYKSSKVQLLRDKYTIFGGKNVFKLLPCYFDLSIEDECGNVVYINLKSVLDLAKLPVDCNESIHYTVMK